MLRARRTRAALVAATIAATSCSASGASGGNRAVPSVSPSAMPSVLPSPSPTVAVSPGFVRPTLPAGGRIVEGLISEIRSGSLKRGFLVVYVDREQTANGVTLTGRFQRQVDCHTGTIGKCRTAFDVTRRLPVSAFRIDAALDTATLTTTVQGKALKATWTGFGNGYTRVNEFGALVIQTRDAAGRGSWDRLTLDEKQDASTSTLLFRRVYAK